LIEVPANNANASELIEAAEKIQPDSPAFTTIIYHVARILIGQGRVDQARETLNALLARSDHLPLSTVNELKALRMTAARNLNEFLQDAPRTPLGFTDTQDGEELPINVSPTPAPTDTPAPSATPVSDVMKFGPGSFAVGVAVAPTPEPPTPTPDPYTEHLKELSKGSLFDDDAASAISRWLPLSMQIEATHSRQLPARLRGQVALLAFMKAILLGDNAAAHGLASQVSDAYPKLKPSIDSWLEAKNSNTQNFAAALMMLRNPGLSYEIESGAGRDTPIEQIDGLRDNAFE
jgi:hypothetical protein